MKMLFDFAGRSSLFCFGSASAPKGQPQISPGQGNASRASVDVALGERFDREDEPRRGETTRGTVVCIMVTLPSRACFALSELIVGLTIDDPGRRCAAIAAPLCPGLVCLAPSGRSPMSVTEREWKPMKRDLAATAPSFVSLIRRRWYRIPQIAPNLQVRSE